MPEQIDNTSATGGFLPLSESPTQIAVEDVLHDLIVGITGLPGDLVRPRWQPEPPREPLPDVHWCAFGILEYEPRNFPEIHHHGVGEGYDEIIDHEILQVLMSFYGPRHLDYARYMRRGMHVAQNRAQLRPAGLAFVKAGTIRQLPALVALKWQPRADLPLTFELETRCTYSALNLKKSIGYIETDQSSTSDNPDGLIVGIGCRGAEE